LGYYIIFNMKKNFKILLTLVLLLSFSVGYSLRTDAAEDESGCAVEERAYESGKRNFSLNVQRTTSNILTASVISLYSHASGINPDSVMKCQNYVKEKVDEDFYTMPDEYVTCPVTDDEKEEVDAMCAALSSDVVGVEKYTTMGKKSVAVDSVNSSLIGLSTMIEGAVVREPLPVNLAYYWNQNVTKIPFAGKALAADGEAYENLPVIKAVYDIWYLAVRISLALLSVVLLYTGIMITMGKKISNQLVVSVQYAMPKIVIGIILIIFSYPIGAAITSISFGLYRGAVPIVFNALGYDSSSTPSGLLMLTLMIETLSMARGGFIYILLSILVLLVLTILRIVLYIKVLIIYLKMAVSIVSAPVEFALGTIPGNDDKMGEWFIRMAKYGLTIFLMGLVVPMTLWVALKLMLAYSVAGGGAAEVGGWGVAFSLITPLLVVVFGFGLGLGMEKRIDGMFGSKKRK